MRRAAEIVLLVAVCYLALFANLHRHTYIKTEGLRAVVVSEMLDRDGVTMPTVHETPYLKKPPLYAWATTLTARQIGRFDEQIARIPSAVFGTLFVLLVYALAERWIGCGAGLVAGAFALLCPTVADYATRAELDMPFSFFCTANIAMTLAALRASGWRSSAWWLAAYAAALVAAFWKGPHSLIFMWLTMIGHALLQRDRSFLKQPAQWLGLAVNLGVLIWWTGALAAFAEPSTVGRAARVELLSRLVPHKLEHFASIFYFPALLAIITLPASAFFLLTLLPEVRKVCGLNSIPMPNGGSDASVRQAALTKPGWWAFLRAWWVALKSSPVALMLLTWLVPSGLFMMWAPAKAPRYSIPLFLPIILLGAWVALLLDAARGMPVERHARRVWRSIFGVFAIGGLFGIVRLLAGLTGRTLGIGTIEESTPWLALAIGCSLPLVADIVRRGCTTQLRVVLVLVAFLSLRPVAQDVWWPRRAKADSQESICKTIEELVSPGERVYVLGNHEFPDTQIYSNRQFRFVASLDEAVRFAGNGAAYAIAQSNELDELTEGTAAKYEIVREFDRADGINVLLRAELPATTNTE